MPIGKSSVISYWILIYFSNGQSQFIILPNPVLIKSPDFIFYKLKSKIREYFAKKCMSIRAVLYNSEYIV